MRIRNFLIAGWTLAAVLSLAAAGAAAPADPVAAFRHALRALAQPPLAASLLPAAQQNAPEYAGRVFEVTGTVDGLVTADGERTVLLSIGSSSLSMRLSRSLRDAAWIDSGRTLRALILVERTGNEISLSNLRLLAAAPEHDVALAERAAQAASRGARRASYPSRFVSYERGRRSGEPVAGVAALPPAAGAGAPIAPLSARALQVYTPYRNAVRKLNRRLSEYDVDKITTSILYFSDQNDIDPRLVMAMIIAESDFNIYSTSHVGAMGLSQLMPSTARGLGVTNPYDPVQNIAAAVHILRGHLDKYGGAPSNAGIIPFDQIALTMAAYNAGPGAVRKYHGVPPYRETKRYIARITALYKEMCGQKGAGKG